MDCTGRQWALMGCTGRYRAVLGCTGLYWAVLGGIGWYWAVLACTRRYWAVVEGSRHAFKYVRKVRCHACDGRTHVQWKVVQYSVSAESAIGMLLWFFETISASIFLILVGQTSSSVCKLLQRTLEGVLRHLAGFNWRHCTATLTGSSYFITSEMRFVMLFWAAGVWNF